MDTFPAPAISLREWADLSRRIETRAADELPSWAIATAEHRAMLRREALTTALRVLRGMPPE